MPSNKYKVFMYPYLKEVVDDYKTAVFNIEVNHSVNQEKQIGFKINYSINNESIMSLIRSSKLRVSCHITCPELGKVITAIFPNNAQELIISCDPMDFSGQTNFVAYLIANEDLLYSNEDLIDSWSGEPSYIEKNNVIGESNAKKIDITHKTDKGKSSIFSFVCVDSMGKGDPYDINLSGQRIVFRMSKEDYILYNAIQSKSHTLVTSTALLNAFVNILNQMIEQKDENDQYVDNDFNNKHKNKNWYKAIEDHYYKLFESYPYEGQKEPFIAAQMLLKSPISKTFEYGKIAQNNSNRNKE